MRIGNERINWLGVWKRNYFLLGDGSSRSLDFFLHCGFVYWKINGQLIIES
jgi:hypothetical protein